MRFLPSDYNLSVHQSVRRGLITLRKKQAAGGP